MLIYTCKLTHLDEPVDAAGAVALLATVGASAPQRTARAVILDEVAIVLHAAPATVEGVLTAAVDEEVTILLEHAVGAVLAVGAGGPERLAATVVEDEVAVTLHGEAVLAILGLEGAVLHEG